MTAVRRPEPTRPPVRLRPAPSIDPPYVEDDPARWLIDGQLALDLFQPGPGPLTRPPGQRRGAGAGPPGPRRTPTRLPATALATATPEGTRVAHRFVTTCLEVINGYRPHSQLRRLLDPTRAAELAAELTRATARAGPVRRRSSRPGTRLRRLRVCEPRDAAVEAAAVLAGPAGRTWAMAIRLERRRGSWLCTALHVL
ncbi:Rv3235 family protein [Salinispora oceanensis]|uniref:Rv3235 family protein n=1 Tax=Salinispora oceanensis TaxID=1050199 RepID=UPI000365D8C4|nr:Rv3235 family protein [Salinispora oceanensis]